MTWHYFPVANSDAHMSLYSSVENRFFFTLSLDRSRILSHHDKFQLLCIIVFIKADKQNGLKIDHFNGIYYFNKTYYLVDDFDWNSNEVYSIKIIFCNLSYYLYENCLNK